MVDWIQRTSGLIRIVFLAIVLIGVGGPCSNLWGAPRIAVAWEFNGTDAEGWQPTHCLAPFIVSGGVLRTRITCDDPYMVGPPVSFPAAQFPYVLVRMRTDTTGTGEIFFSSSVRPGIVAGNEVGFATRGDGRFHTYIVPMHTVTSWGGTIDRLRLDPESVATEGAVEIDFIRVVSERFLGDWIFDAPGADLGWRPNPNLAPFRIQGGLLATDVIDGGASDPWMEGPEVELDADRFHVLQVRQRVTGTNQNYAAVYFTTVDSPVPGEDKVVTVPITADGVWRRLHFNLAAHPRWQGTITSLRLDPVDTNARPTHIEIAYIGFGSHWDFDLGDTMGWRAEVAMSRLTAREAALRSVMEGDDPHMAAAANVRAEDFPFVALRMSLDDVGPCDPRIYFATDTAPESEQAARSFPAICDGAMRTYVVRMTDNPLWRGHITRFRLDPKGTIPTGRRSQFAAEYIRLLPGYARLRVLSLGTSEQPLFAGRAFEIVAGVRSDGTETAPGATLCLALTGGVSPPNGGSTVTLPLGDLAAAAERTVRTTLRFAACGAGSVQATATASGVPDARPLQQSLTAYDALPALPSAAPDAPRAVGLKGGHALLESPTLRLLFLNDRCSGGIAPPLLWLRQAGVWRPMGMLEAPGRFVYRSAKTGDRDAFAPASGAPVPNTAGVSLSSSFTDADGNDWSLTFDYRMDDAGQSIGMTYRLTPSAAASLLYFAGPMLRAGAGPSGFGSIQDQAVFPGLEWLVRGERSSSTLDISTEERFRQVPHPLKITLPIMAVAQGGGFVALAWDPRQAWHGEQTQPSAVFASPNWLDNTPDHLMGLFAPSVPDFVPENARRATRPYLVPAGDAVTLQATLLARATGDITQTFEEYTARFGDVDPGDAPRSLDTQRRLHEDAYLQTLYVPSVPGWRHATSFPGGPWPEFIAIVHKLARQETDPQRAARLRALVPPVLEAARRQFGDGGLWQSAGAHILGGELPFLIGRLDAALNGWKASADGLRATQPPGGCWAYAGRDDLGTVGQTELGLCAAPAWSLLKWSRISGDAQTAAAGMRALEAMRAFTVPRAAQTWEVPVHTPDLLAAAYGVLANVEGYRLTGDTRWLEEARRWARAGMLFVYGWSDGARAVMPGSSIPVFGATFYTLSWIGKAVQWNGLVFAYGLAHLSTIDDGRDWITPARALLYSGLRQQREESALRGTYPDAWHLIPNRHVGVYISPESLVKVGWLLDDESFDLDTAFLTSGTGGLRVTSAARVTDATYDKTKRIATFNLRLQIGETSYVLVANAPAAPGRVLGVQDNRTINEVADLDAVPEGWRYMAASRWLLVKISHHAAQEPLQIAWP